MSKKGRKEPGSTAGASGRTGRTGVEVRARRDKLKKTMSMTTRTTTVMATMTMTMTTTEKRTEGIRRKNRSTMKTRICSKT